MAAVHKRNQYPNIDRIPSMAIYLGEMEDHPFAEVISDWFKERGLPETPTVTNPSFAGWSFYDAEERLGYHFGVHRDYRSQIYVSATIIFALLPLNQPNDAATKLLRENIGLVAPAKYAVLLLDGCAITFECHAQLVDTKQLTYRLKFLFDLARHSRDEFTKEQFGLTPLPDSWFKLPIAS
jgi:hypothetical protein